MYNSKNIACKKKCKYFKHFISIPMRTFLFDHPKSMKRYVNRFITRLCIYIYRPSNVAPCSNFIYLFC